ncbi:MAG: NAD(P)H-dependent glycerol-3-phosphate dehydrogenase [Candidatus Spyradocola sp.]|jgi:glycerol-3-phosphate dehydrogenase (NAD(P)+)
MRITVLGCGRWGTFLTWYLHRTGHEVALYGRKTSWRMARLLESRENDLLLLPDGVPLTTDLAAAVLRAEVLVISVGVQSFRGLLRELRALDLSGRALVLCMKGLEAETGARLTEMVAQELGPVPCGIWVGPGHVQDFLRGVPNCMVIDSADAGLRETLVQAFSSDLIRFYYGDDLIGNEIGAAAKNVVGIAAGMLDGYGLTSLKGALMARGTREVGRLIGAMGGSERSAYGLAHLGDYEATVFSPYSHNRAFGEQFARGESYTQLAEGAATAKALRVLSARCGVDLPICGAVYAVLYEGMDPQEALSGLFLRSLKREF